MPRSSPAHSAGRLSAVFCDLVDSIHTIQSHNLFIWAGMIVGFDQDDVSVLVDLVRHHLLLPDTATRRDLDDPTTIARVAAAAGNRLTLHLLAALTEADSKATGPSAWGACRVPPGAPRRFPAKADSAD